MRIRPTGRGAEGARGVGQATILLAVAAAVALAVVLLKPWGGGGAPLPGEADLDDATASPSRRGPQDDGMLRAPDGRSTPRAPPAPATPATPTSPPPETPVTPPETTAPPESEADQAANAAFDAALAGLLRLLEDGEAAAGDGEEALQQHRNDVRTAQDQVAGLLGGDPERAQRVLDAFDLASTEEAAVALAAVLRRAPDGDIPAALAERATVAREPAVRRAALAAVEERDASVWLDAATRAFQDDSDVSVRDAAAQVLGRTLARDRFRASHPAVKRALQAALDDGDATVRVRAITALAEDRRPLPEDVERVRQMEEDRDAFVRDAARRAVETLSGRAATEGAGSR